MSTELEVRETEAVDQLCATEAERRGLPERAGTRVRDAFLLVTYPDVDRRAAKQAIAGALWRHAQGSSKAWRSEEHGGAVSNDRIAESARALAVIAALGDERILPVGSAHATRDKNRALLKIKRCVGEQEANSAPLGI